MKKFYGPIVTGLTLLTIATPIANTTTVKAAENDNTNAITQSESDGYEALLDQQNRLQEEETSGKYNPAQVTTLEKVLSDSYHQENISSDNQMAVMAQQLKEYLDKGVVGYSTDAWSGGLYPMDINGEDYISPTALKIYTFKDINEPEIKQLDFPGYTIVDSNGTPHSDNRLKMWLDSDYKLHADPNFITDIGFGFNNCVMLVKNGEKVKTTNNKYLHSSENEPVENITTVTTNGPSYLYTIDGTRITNRMLAGDSEWYSDKYKNINGERMYRVATNEWVRAADIY